MKNYIKKINFEKFTGITGVSSCSSGFPDGQLIPINPRRGDQSQLVAGWLSRQVNLSKAIDESFTPAGHEMI